MPDISTFINGLPGYAAQGVIWGIMALGLYISYRLLDFADLTVDGSFATGAAVTVMLILAGWPAWAAMLVALIAGMAAGFITGVLHTVLGIAPILAGILTQIALYSVNLHILGNKPNQALSVDKYNLLLSLRHVNTAILVALGFAAALILLFYWFFGTELGCAIRATGSNMKMARALGINTDWMIILGLMISNALIALSGSLIAQFDYGSALVNMGQGTIVIGLASVIIGEVIFIHKERSFAFKLTAVIIGAIIYRTIIALALTIKGFKATDLKLITAIIVAIALAIPVFKTKISFMRHKSANKQGR